MHHFNLVNVELTQLYRIENFQVRALFAVPLSGRYVLNCFTAGIPSLRLFTYCAARVKFVVMYHLL